MTPPPAAAVWTGRLLSRPTSKLDGLNARQHYMARARRAHYWKVNTALSMHTHGCPTPLPENGRGYRVVITVEARRGRMDDDNLAGCCKAIRDGIASYLGVSDAPGGVEWEYRWQRGAQDRTVIELRLETSGKR